jgi:hypothetical protein
MLREPVHGYRLARRRPIGDRGALANTQGARAVSMWVCGWEAVAAFLAGASHRGRGSFHSLRTRGNSKAI